MSRPPYMVQLCQKLFNLEDSVDFLPEACTNWLRQALDHCMAVLTKKPGCQKLWNKLKSLVFPEQTTSLMSNKAPISVHLDLLGPKECQDLAKQVILDYIHYTPRYVSILQENHSLWQVIRGLFGVLVIGTFVMILARRYHAISSPVKSEQRKGPSLHDLLLRKSLRRVLYETKNLAVVPATDPSLLQCGCPAVGLQINAKQLCHIKGILLKATMTENAADADSAKMQSLAKIQKFFQNPGHYRIVISLDLTNDDKECQDASSTMPKTSAIPIHKPARRVGIRRRM